MMRQEQRESVYKFRPLWRHDDDNKYGHYTADSEQLSIGVFDSGGKRTEGKDDISMSGTLEITKWYLQIVNDF